MAGVGGKFVALGGLASGLAKHYETQEQRKYEQAKQMRDMVAQAISAGISSGRLTDSNYALRFLLHVQQSGGKFPTPGKELKPLPPGVDRISSAIQGMAEPQWPLPSFLSSEEFAKREGETQGALAAARAKAQGEEADRRYEQLILNGWDEGTAKRIAYGVTILRPRRLSARTSGADILTMDPDARDIGGAPIRKDAAYAIDEDPDDFTRSYTPTFAPASLVDRDLQRRTTDIKATLDPQRAAAGLPPLTDEEAQQIAARERQSERENRASAIALSLIQTRLSIRQRQDLLEGKMPYTQAWGIVREFARSNPDVRLEDIDDIARYLVDESKLGGRLTRQATPPPTTPQATPPPTTPQGASFVPFSSLPAAEQARLDDLWDRIPHPPPNAPLGTMTPQETQFLLDHPGYIDHKMGAPRAIGQGGAMVPAPKVPALPPQPRTSAPPPGSAWQQRGDVFTPPPGAQPPGIQAPIFPPGWSTAKENAFRQWYGAVARRWRLSGNPDDPAHQYDYRRAYLAGAAPDAQGHWPSEFKLLGHPDLIIGGVDTRTGQSVAQAPTLTPTGPPIPAAVAAPARPTTQVTDWASRRFRPGQLNTAQRELVEFAETSLALVPYVLRPIEEAGLQNEMGGAAALNTRLQYLLYITGTTTDNWNSAIQQFAGAIEAYMTRALLRGRPNLVLQAIYRRHIPNAAADPPGLLYRKTQELAKLIKIASDVVLKGVNRTPDQLGDDIASEYFKSLYPDEQLRAEQLKQFHEGLGGTGTGVPTPQPRGKVRGKIDEWLDWMFGTGPLFPPQGNTAPASPRPLQPPPPAATDQELRLRARLYLLQQQTLGKIPASVTIDDAAIDKFLAGNPTFK